jgi:hypothetical protein
MRRLLNWSGYVFLLGTFILVSVLGLFFYSQFLSLFKIFNLVYAFSYFKTSLKLNKLWLLCLWTKF